MLVGMAPASQRRHTVLFTLLYASEGAPIGFIWWALPTVLRAADVPIERITALTAVLVLPWTFKFLWAPLVDRLRSRRWGFRAWIASAQLAMAGCLVPLIWIDPVEHFAVWQALLLAHAVAAATQDVAIDAFAIQVVPETGRGLLNGSMQAGMLVGRSVFGGGSLIVLGLFGREWILAALVVWILVALGALGALRLAEPAARGGAGAPRLGAALRAMLRRRTTWWGLAFALVGAAGFEAAGQLAGPYLVDRGETTSAIGLFFGAVVVAATITGGLVGGRISDRWGRLRSCAVFLLGFVAVIAALGVIDFGGAASPLVRYLLLGAMYLFVGLFTAASYALFMDLTDPAIGGTQFSTYMSATNACESWSAWVGGRVAGASGYPAAFLVMSAASLVGLPVLARLRRLAASRRRASASTSPSRGGR
jgi:MFS family permease